MRAMLIEAVRRLISSSRPRGDASVPSFINVLGGGAKVRGGRGERTPFEEEPHQYTPRISAQSEPILRKSASLSAYIYRSKPLQ
jgi:hypothetical protein